jgi:hypothetical protein
MANTPAPSLADLARNLVLPPEPPEGWTESRLAQLNAAQRFALTVNSFQVLRTMARAYRGLGPRLVAINRQAMADSRVLRAAGRMDAYAQARQAQEEAHDQHQRWLANIAKMDWLKGELRKLRLVSMSNTLGAPAILLPIAMVATLVGVVLGIRDGMKDAENTAARAAVARQAAQNVAGALQQAQQQGATVEQTQALVEAVAEAGNAGTAGGGGGEAAGGGRPGGVMETLVDKIAWPLGAALAAAVVLPPVLGALTDRRND